jgi:hypothetical protein
VTKKRSYSEEVGDAIEGLLDACGDPRDTAAEDWAAWWRGDRLRQPHKHAVPPDVEIAHDIHNWLYHDGTLTQAKFAQALRRFNNDITNLFSELLAPGGHEDWKLTLKQSRRGAPRKGDPLEVVAHFYDQFVEEHGERGAVKRFAKKYEMTPAAVRSALRRNAGTHDKRRPHWLDTFKIGGKPARQVLRPDTRFPRKRGRKK